MRTRRGGGKIGKRGMALDCRDDPGHCLPGPHQRGAEAARSLLGTFAGILVTDRWAPTTGGLRDKRQLCWAHLLRDFTFISQSKGTAGSVGRRWFADPQAFSQLVSSTRWDHDPCCFRAKRGAGCASTSNSCSAGVSCHAPKVAGMCEEILKLYAALWTFAVVEGVEPTNNFAGEKSGAAVLWRKGSSAHTARGQPFRRAD